MKTAIIATVCAATLAAGAKTSARGAKRPAPFEDDLLVQVKSSLDGTMQPC